MNKIISMYNEYNILKKAGEKKNNLEKFLNSIKKYGNDTIIYNYIIEKLKELDLSNIKINDNYLLVKDNDIEFKVSIDFNIDSIENIYISYKSNEIKEIKQISFDEGYIFSGELREYDNIKTTKNRTYKNNELLYEQLHISRKRNEQNIDNVTLENYIFPTTIKTKEYIQLVRKGIINKNDTNYYESSYEKPILFNEISKKSSFLNDIKNNKKTIDINIFKRYRDIHNTTIKKELKIK